MIDRRDGSIRFEEPAYRIAADLTPSGFLASPLAGRAAGRSDKQYVFDAVWWCGETVAGSLQFEGGILRAVHLQVVRAEFGTSWADATEEKELARKEAHEVLAARALGEPLSVLASHPTDPRRALLGRDFPWGRVRSSYDFKSGFSTLAVEYLIETAVGS